MADDLLIHELGLTGDGIHQSEQGRVYIDRTLPGDSIRAKVRKTGGVLRGDLIEVVAHSPHRLTAPCQHYAVCGGCSLQHATEEFYRNWKVEIVRVALERQGLSPKIWHDPLFLPGGNRRRATFAATKRNSTVRLGYFRRRSHDITDITSCLVLDPLILQLRLKLETALAPALQEGKTVDVFVQSINGLSEVVITGPVGEKGVPDLQMHEAAADLVQASGISRMSWRAREHDEAEVQIEIRPLQAKFGSLDVALPPLAFLQPTLVGEHALVAAVMDVLPMTGKFADLFSGCGTFTGHMLERGSVDAYESVGPAIRALNKSKGAKSLNAVHRDLFRNPLGRDEASGYDALVFDPPRAGAEEQVKELALSKIPRLVAVSCNPVTFARDARILVEGGYVLDSVKAVDQFTWSHHVELVAAFTK